MSENTHYRPSRSENPKVAANREAKAERLIAEGKCHALAVVPGKLWAGVIVGDSGRYLVADVNPDMISALNLGTGLVPVPQGCPCPQFVNVGRCAHARAAQKLRIASEPVEELFERAAGR
jgi:hypothetical protein